jgi:hypothetical protein
MDYYTRKNLAQSGQTSVRIPARGYPHLSALGLRVPNGRVDRGELCAATADLGLAVAYADDKQLDGAAAEAALASLGIAPDELKRRMQAFLESLLPDGKKP